jgi:hypothetical protein
VAAVVELKIEGLETTLRRLQAFPGRVQRKCLRKAVAAGASSVVKAVKARSPRSTGIFRRSIAAKIKGYQSGEIYVAIVGQADKIRSAKKVRAGRGGISGRGDIVPIHFVEEGVKPHQIPKEDGRGTRAIRLPNGRYYFRIQHPGYAGKHPVARAADARTMIAPILIEKKLSELIDRLEVTE